MRVKRENLFHLIEPMLPHVEKPSRYLNHEWGAVEEQEGPFHVCMVYADVYEVGQPNLGIAILYNALNKAPHISCERAYLPWVDMAALMRKRNVPLLSLEGAAPLASFDVVGFTLAHEMIATNIIETLDLAGIPMLAEERDEEDPLIFGGGPSVWNSEPVAPLFDAILLGDGEEALVEMCECVRTSKLEGVSRQEILQRLSEIQGVYVPSLYQIVHDNTSTRWGYAVPKEGSSAPSVVYKRCLPDLSVTNPVAQRIVPYTEIVQDRLALEIQRGCARGCRFCQAGMTYRPVRERPAQQIVKAGEEGLLKSGYDEVSLTSLSTTDHSQCGYILRRMNSDLRKRGVRISIPSQRMDAFGAEMADAVSTSRRGGLTFAPEAGSQRMRDVINKNVTEDDLESAARNAFENGWRRMKLYFMMGLPTETDEDIQAIPAVAKRILDIGREIGGKGVTVSASVAVFVPKSYTPFQWVGQISREEAQRRQQLLLSSNHDRGLKIAYHDSGTSLVEGALSKMGRDGFDLIYRAWKNGCKFDAWTSEFNLDAWNAAAESLGFSLSDIATETFDIQAKLPWDHTSPGVSKGYLQREYRKAMDEVTTPDCTFTSCTGCAVCQTLKVDNVLMGGALMTDVQEESVAPEVAEPMKKDWRAGRPQIQPEIMTERGAEIFRLRVAYKKDDRLAFLGHLELIGTIERCVRRAQLPFRVGNGFAKRMGVQFSQALPVGASSEAEYFDLKLTEYVDPDEALERLLSATPPALAPFAASYVDRSLPALEAWLNAAHWRCDILGEGLRSDALRWGFEDLLAKKELTYMRGDKQKVVNLETTFAGYKISESSSETCISFELDTLQDPRAALRPAVLIYEAQRIAAQAGVDGLQGIDSLKVCRTSQAHVSENGLLVKPL